MDKPRRLKLDMYTTVDAVHFKKNFQDVEEKCFFVGDHHFDLKKAKRLKAWLNKTIKWMEK